MKSYKFVALTHLKYGNLLLVVNVCQYRCSWLPRKTSAEWLFLWPWRISDTLISVRRV